MELRCHWDKGNKGLGLNLYVKEQMDSSVTKEMTVGRDE